MVAKISVGNSLYGAIAYNGEKINEAQGRLLTTNRIYNDGSGTVDIGKAMEGFLTFLPPQMKIEKPVVHISLNPHPEDVLTDIELQNIAREYLEKLGFGNQPYLVFKHEDIDRHHLHIVTVNVDENGKRLNRDFLYRRSDRIRRELEQKYGLHPAERKNQRLDNPLRKVAASAGDVKKQVGNTVKALNGQYRFQTMGEYRALLSLYNMTVEEARGNVRGREYHGLVYSVTDDNDVFTMEDEPIASVVQDMRKGSKWLSAFLESYRPPLDGERYLTDGEVSELLRVSRRTLQEYRNNRVLPFILLGGKVLYPETGLRGVLEANYRKPLE